jgi:hypothetical protein
MPNAPSMKVEALIKGKFNEIILPRVRRRKSAIKLVTRVPGRSAQMTGYWRIIGKMPAAPLR